MLKKVDVDVTCVIKLIRSFLERFSKTHFDKYLEIYNLFYKCVPFTCVKRKVIADTSRKCMEHAEEHDT